MENEKTPLYVAFSTQKGGVGKTTFTVLAASYLYYLKGYDVAVVDCDYPQHSIAGMRKRDAEQVGADENYKRMAYEQFTRLEKKAYPVLCSSPEKAIATADEYIAGHVPDIVFFDLPGTVNSEGVINSLVVWAAPHFYRKSYFFGLEIFGIICIINLLLFSSISISLFIPLKPLPAIISSVL